MDAEFEVRIHRIVQRATWQMAAIILVWQASMFAVLLTAIER